MATDTPLPTNRPATIAFPTARQGSDRLSDDHTSRSELPAFSVLMSVYKNDQAEHVFAAIQSVTVDQTHAPTEVVLVVDGPVDDDIRRVVRFWEVHPTANLQALWLDENVGLAKAMNLGLRLCRHDYVARMDSDDVCDERRFEEQFAFLVEHPEIALLGSFYVQYDSDLRHVVTDRKVPTDSHTVMSYARWRTPFNHVTAIFRRDAVESIGGYPDIDGHLEDWWIALRLLKRGHRIANLPAYHVKVRGDDAFIRRRGGWRYLQLEWSNLIAMSRDGLMSRRDVTTNLVMRSTVRLVPVWARKHIYRAIRKVA